MKRVPRGPHVRRWVGVIAALAALVAPLAYVGFTPGALVLSVARHLSVLFALVGVLAVVHREWRTALLVALACVGLWLPWWIASVPTVEVAAPTSPCRRLFVGNVFERNVEPTDAIRASLDAARADVTLLIEPRPDLVAELARTATVILHHDAEAKFDLAALVVDRTFVRASRLHTFEGTGSVVGEVELACEVPVSVFFVHIPAPTVPHQQRARWHMKDALAAIVRAREHVVVAGDFNATPPSPVLRDLAAGAELVRVTSGATWPVRSGPVGVPIDHVFVRGVDVRVERHSVAGSDHAGYIVEVSPRRRGP
ncbi:MAG: endonuclease/exonuclease/phosphatase family protein [Deltaproteobacteria bacterium]